MVVGDQTTNRGRRGLCVDRGGFVQRHCSSKARKMEAARAVAGLQAETSVSFLDCTGIRGACHCGKANVSSRFPPRISAVNHLESYAYVALFHVWRVPWR